MDLLYTWKSSSCHARNELANVVSTLWYEHHDVLHHLRIRRRRTVTNLIADPIQYVLNVAFTIPAIIYIDKWGRRPMLLVGTLLMGFS